MDKIFIHINCSMSSTCTDIISYRCSDSSYYDNQYRHSFQHLRAQIMLNDLLMITATWSLPRKIIQLTRNLMNLAA